jgi:hypothetical protein
MHPSSIARLEESDALCEIVSSYIGDYGCQIVVRVNEIPAGLWDEQPGLVIGPSVKREVVGPHIVEYWRAGA